MKGPSNVSEYAAEHFADELARRKGSFVGHGTNHEGDPFRGTLHVEPLIARVGARITYVAQGTDGSYNGIVLHAEEAMIAPSSATRLALWNAHSNSRHLIDHDAVEIEERNGTWFAIFDSGKPPQTGGLHERIHVTLWRDGDVSYDYEWAVGEMSMATRSRVRMKKIDENPS